MAVCLLGPLLAPVSRLLPFIHIFFCVLPSVPPPSDFLIKIQSAMSGELFPSLKFYPLYGMSSPTVNCVSSPDIHIFFVFNYRTLKIRSNGWDIIIRWNEIGIKCKTKSFFWNSKGNTEWKKEMHSNAALLCELDRLKCRAGNFNSIVILSHLTVLESAHSQPYTLYWMHFSTNNISIWSFVLGHFIVLPLNSLCFILEWGQDQNRRRGKKAEERNECIQKSNNKQYFLWSLGRRRTKIVSQQRQKDRYYVYEWLCREWEELEMKKLKKFSRSYTGEISHWENRCPKRRPDNRLQIIILENGLCIVIFHVV